MGKIFVDLIVVSGYNVCEVMYLLGEWRLHFLS